MAEYVEKTIKKQYVYKGKILSLRVDDALLPNGKPCVREIVEHSGGACALYVENDRAVFVRQ
ncbi:MAG: ADP-ribose pyrophosphatase, partial [Clostridia bacterium]|nr:ADP-ribose pyrophosphatase [Clostridia bacterium]